MKKLYLSLIISGAALTANAQSAIDAYRISQPDLKGTARFMSMGGAFGALGGDLSCLSQNPGGIGIYRGNEVGFTLDLDMQHSVSNAGYGDFKESQTKFLLNNLGFVSTLRLNAGALKNLNIGFTYNKAASFNRKYSGGMRDLQVSLTNYIAGIANNAGLTVGDVESSNNYDPYNPKDGGIQSPWLAILGYDSYFINPDGDPDNPYWNAQYDRNFIDPADGLTKTTTGSAKFSALEKGSVDEYNIALGGNISNTLYWGMNFDIINLDYSIDADYGENLQDAWVFNNRKNAEEVTTSQWNLNNFYRMNGTGFNYQLGFILKPIQELRIGFAFHTPTWYKLTETYSAVTQMKYFGTVGSAATNDGVPGYNDVNMRTPWKLIGSLAGVIGGKLIVSADYEWQAYNTMQFSTPTNNWWNYGYDYDDWGWSDWDSPWYGAPRKSAKQKSASTDAYYDTNQDIKDVYRSTNTLRLGAEYRVTPNFSLRAGYSFVSSPVQVKARDNQQYIYTSGTLPSYRFDNDTNYATCGLGYHSGGFYLDLAYVYKHLDSNYHAFTNDVGAKLPNGHAIESPQSKVTFDNSQVVMSMGWKF